MGLTGLHEQWPARITSASTLSSGTRPSAQLLSHQASTRGCGRLRGQGQRCHVGNIRVGGAIIAPSGDSLRALGAVSRAQRVELLDRREILHRPSELDECDVVGRSAKAIIRRMGNELLDENALDACFRGLRLPLKPEACKPLKSACGALLQHGRAVRRRQHPLRADQCPTTLVTPSNRAAGEAHVCRRLPERRQPRELSGRHRRPIDDQLAASGCGHDREKH